ncbi:MAG: hemolysin III family protein [Planctomycetes bacterium]|nr:hemolysin III family protein [Planctomycetota bacterium]
MYSQLTISRPTERISLTEEQANFFTHGLGMILSAFGAALMYQVLGTDDIKRTIGCAVYVASLIGVYTMSTLSHSFENPRLRSFFRALDQGTIYLLIAGTYTPFAMAYLHTTGWWIVLGLVWAVAIGGFLSKVWFTHRVESVSMWPCVILGAMPLTSIPTLLGVVSIAALWWMVIGIACYIIGLWFWLNDSRGRHFHAVWHLLVIAGSTFHFMGILLFVVMV